ncbi:aminopeptidase N [Asticcacaulis sp. AND118]|uniref:aminopeptidase N n=1 Tax=Asticcacaulis sp. AND118 TaxID=2840468 RepID=UPI001CFFD782|nr:aminopeptidase N [Asticcacaulis sp. AND118]UDF03157.1 aminopeptidase N [Asticcacaulis sp. AND118]
MYRTDIARPIRLTDYRAPDFHITDTRLDFDLHPTQTQVKATYSVERRGAEDAPLVLLGERLTLKTVRLDGADLTPADYQVTAETLTIKSVPDRFKLEIAVEINPQDNKTLEGLYMSSGRYCTQCEAEGFRKIVYFPDRPDVLSKYTVRMRAPKAGFPRLLSNGNLIETGEDGDAHYAVWEDPFPKPAYLFALVAGELDVLEDRFTTMSGRTVELKIFVDTGMSARAEYAMDALKRSMRWDEDAYGREYDLDLFMIVAVRDFNFGAMENKGLNIFNASLLLADPETATDLDYERIESVVAHEYFHNWSGNRVTCRDWFQLCLKEGLTVFRDQSFSGDQRGHAVQRIKDVKMLRARQFPEDAGPLAHPVRPASYLKIDNFYTATIYEKGAEIVGMLKTVVGPDVYRRALDHYFETNDGTAATLEDFLTSFEAVTGEDFAPWLKWYVQAGTPTLGIGVTYDAASKRLTLNLSQQTPPTPTQAHKSPVPIPVRLGLLTQDGAPLSFVHDGATVTDTLFLLTGERAQLIFEDVAEAPVVSALRGFSAPVKLRLDEPEAHRFARFRGDPDPFNRWEAAQSLAKALILDPQGSAADYAEALRATLSDATLDAAFKALMTALPTEMDLAQSLTPVDPAFIHARRKAFKTELAAALKTDAQALYDAVPAEVQFSPDAASAGRRALRNALLDLIVSVDPNTATTLAETHYRSATNMTDMIAGLNALSQIHGEPYQRALDHFYERYKFEPLVLDKWFAVQAACAHPETLERVRRLIAHPDFDRKVPNRWRSVAQAFAANNPAVFHDISGEGYAFIADEILSVDRFNPMTAARLIEAFGGFKRYAEPHAGLMKAVLERIVATDGLSKNVAELAGKALAG